MYIYNIVSDIVLYTCWYRRSIGANTTIAIMATTSGLIEISTHQ